MKKIIKRAPLPVLGSFILLILLFASCKTTDERIKEQSQTQNPITNYVKTPIDRTKDMKGQVETAQNSVARQAQSVAENPGE